MYERFAPRSVGPIPPGDVHFVETAQSLSAEPAEPAFTQVTPEETGTAAAMGTALGGIFKDLAGRLHLQDITVDDLLLLGILILILRKESEWDVLLIMAVLFFLGLFEAKK